MNQTDTQRKRPSLKQIQAGSWYRFSDYELRGGYIRPKTGAQLERYDPWQARPTSDDPRKREPAPYESLIRTVQALHWKDSSESEPIDDWSQQRLLGWCRQHGLLGILLHVSYRVQLAPRWLRLTFDREGGSVKISSGGPPGHKLMPLSIVYSREPAGWREAIDRFDMRSRPYDRRIEGTVVHGPNRKPLLGRVLVHDLPGDHPHLRWNQDELRESWGRFFPGVPEVEKETYGYPFPGSEAFWMMYAEPLEEFVVGVEALALALRNLKVVRKQRRSIDFTQVTEPLNSLVSGISPRISGLGPHRLEWQSPSLLGSYALMALLDLVAESARVCQCGVCSTVFISNAYQSLYCSDTCRNTAQKRRQRARRKKEAVKDQSRISGSASDIMPRRPRT